MLGHGQARPPDDFFGGLLSVDKLTRSVLLTSANLYAREMQRTSWEGVPEWVGVTLLEICHECGARADLRVTLASNTCMPAPAFGTRTGLSRRRLGAL